MKKNLLLLSLCAAFAIPAATAKQEITLAVNESSIYRIDAGTGEKTEADPSSFFALIETDSEPVVSLECVNMGTGTQPNLNNMAISGDWFNLYSGNGEVLVPDYQLSVPEGYVIRNISVTLVAIDNYVETWEIAGEEFTPSATGTEVSVDCDDQMVHIYCERSEVKPTQFVNFVVTVAEEGEEDEEGGDDTPSTPEPGEEITIASNDSNIFRIDAGTGEKTEADPASFFALVETKSEPVLSLECVNMGTGAQPNMNNIQINGDWFNLYSNKETTLVGDYQLSVSEGYVIKNVSVTLVAIDNVVYDWEIAGETFTTSATGTEVSVDCDDQMVHIYADNGDVKPTQFANFIVTVAKEGAGVNGIEVDANAPVVYYDLQGRKINNPSNGLFIRLQGNKASKVIIK